MRPARWPARSHSSGGGAVCGNRREHVDGGGGGGGGRGSVRARATALCRRDLVGHRQLDWLWSRKAQEGRSHEGLCSSSDAGDLCPGLEGLGSGGSILAGRAVIAAEVEEIVDPIMGGEEALSLAG